MACFWLGGKGRGRSLPVYWGEGYQMDLSPGHEIS